MVCCIRYQAALRAAGTVVGAEGGNDGPRGHLVMLKTREAHLCLFSGMYPCQSWPFSSAWIGMYFFRMDHAAANFTS